MSIDAWYRRYGESVYRRCLRLAREEARAWDLTQEAFLRAHRYRHSFRGDSTPLAWLFKVADRCFLDDLRRRRETPVAEPEELDLLLREEEGLDAVFSRHDLVARLLARAPNDVRTIVIGRYFDELEHGEIASQLGINEKTVRRKLERFLASARKLVRR